MLRGILYYALTAAAALGIDDDIDDGVGDAHIPFILVWYAQSAEMSYKVEHRLHELPPHGQKKPAT